MTPEDVLPIYERSGPAWAAERSKALFERAALVRLPTAMPGPDLLDLGCGSGDPLARELARLGCAVTGVDGAASMIALFRRTLPDAEALQAGMRTLSVGRRFDGILAWDSFFRLTPEDQAAAFPVVAAHTRPDAAAVHRRPNGGHGDRKCRGPADLPRQPRQQSTAAFSTLPGSKS